MKQHREWGMAMRLWLCAAALMCGVAAHADVLIDNNVRVTLPAMPTSDTLALGSPGVLTMTVSDLLWPQALQSLSFAISDHDGVLASKVGAGALFYEIANPGTYFANVYAAPTLLSGVGLYHINVSFMPTVVPLPAAAWLLISALFGVTQFVWRRKSKSQTDASVSTDATIEPTPVQSTSVARRASETSRERTQQERRRAWRGSRRKVAASAHEFVTNSVVQ